MSASGSTLSTGIAGADEIMGGGFTRNYMYLIQGGPGSGKTTFATQVLLSACDHGLKCLYVTLTETKRELSSVAQSHGWDISKIDILEVSAAEQLKSTQQNQTVFHPQEQSLALLMQVIVEEIEKRKPDIVVLDSLSEIRLSSATEHRYRQQILTLRQFFADRNMTSLLLDDHIDPADPVVKTLCHGSLFFHQQTPIYGRKRRRFEIIKFRGVDFSEGLHDFNIRKGGVEVYPRLIASESRPGESAENLKSGVSGLDELLGGGLPTANSALFIGPAGVGKTSLATQYVSSHCAEGGISSFYIFDESKHVFLDRFATININIKQYVSNGCAMVRQIDPAEQTPGQFIQLVKHDVDKKNSRLVVIDSLNGFMKAMPGEPYLSIHLHELLTFLGQRGVCTILIVSQSGLVGSNKQPVDVSYLADTVLLFKFFEHKGNMRKAVTVYKKRGGEHEQTINELLFTKNGLKIGRPLDNLAGILSGLPTELEGYGSPSGNIETVKGIE